MVSTYYLDPPYPTMRTAVSKPNSSFLYTPLRLGQPYVPSQPLVVGEQRRNTPLAPNKRSTAAPINVAHTQRQKSQARRDLEAFAQARPSLMAMLAEADRMRTPPPKRNARPRRRPLDQSPVKAYSRSAECHSMTSIAEEGPTTLKQVSPVLHCYFAAPQQADSESFVDNPTPRPARPRTCLDAVVARLSPRRHDTVARHAVLDVTLDTARLTLSASHNQYQHLKATRPGAEHQDTSRRRLQMITDTLLNLKHVKGRQHRKSCRCDVDLQLHL